LVRRWENIPRFVLGDIIFSCYSTFDLKQLSAENLSAGFAEESKLKKIIARFHVLSIFTKFIKEFQ
jgi:hypothetical protein